MLYTIFAAKMKEIYFLTFLIVCISIILLSVRLFFGKKFVKTHIDQSKEMQERGIHCVQTQDFEARNANKYRIK